MAYEDGEVRQQFSIAFRAHVVGGEPRTSSENKAVEWVATADLSALAMHPPMEMRLEHGVRRGATCRG